MMLRIEHWNYVCVYFFFAGLDGTKNVLYKKKERADIYVYFAFLFLPIHLIWVYGDGIYNINSRRSVVLEEASRSCNK